MTNFHVSDGHNVILRPNFVPSISVMAHQKDQDDEGRLKYEHLRQVSKPECQFKFSAVSALSALRGFPAAPGALLGPTEWQSACPAALPWCCSTRSIRAALPPNAVEENTFMASNGTKKAFAPSQGGKAHLLFESGPVASI